MFEDVVDDDGVGGRRCLRFEEIMDDIHAVLLAKTRQAAGRLVASVPVRIILHEVAEFSPPAADLDNLGSRLQMQVNQPSDLMMTAAEAPIEFCQIPVIRRIETCGRSVHESTIGALFEVIGRSAALDGAKWRSCFRAAERANVTSDRPGVTFGNR